VKVSEERKGKEKKRKREESDVDIFAYDVLEKNYSTCNEIDRRLSNKSNRLTIM
jgi:hypothetical protein